MPRMSARFASVREGERERGGSGANGSSASPYFTANGDGGGDDDELDRGGLAGIRWGGKGEKGEEAASYLMGEVAQLIEHGRRRVGEVVRGLEVKDDVGGPHYKGEKERE